MRVRKGLTRKTERERLGKVGAGDSGLAPPMLYACTLASSLNALGRVWKLYESCHCVYGMITEWMRGAVEGRATPYLGIV